MDIILGKVGIWTFDFDRQSMAQVREEVADWNWSISYAQDRRP